MNIPRRVALTLRRVYYDPTHPAGFSGIARLAKATRQNRTTVQQWLQKQATHQLHYPIRRKFPRSKIYSPREDFSWEADLTDMSNLRKNNGNVRFLLVAIDVFSKRAKVQPIQNKSAAQVTKAFAKMIKQNGVPPRRLRTDQGKEFQNSSFKALMNSHGIKHYTTNDADIKTGVAERYNRTIKDKLFKYMTANNSRHYISALPAIVAAYNETEHSSHGLKPNNVTKRMRAKVHNELYGHEGELTKRYAPKLRKNDRVLISLDKGVFRRGFTRNYKKEPYVVERLATSHYPYRYVLSAENGGETIQGSFYEAELVKVPDMSTIRRA